MTSPMIASPSDLAVPDPNLIARSGVIVTGASSGLGRATALLLAKAGRPIAVWGRNERRAEAVAAECRAHGVSATSLAFDIGDRQAVMHAVTESGRILGTIGGLAVCHGISPLGTVGHLDFGVLDRCIRINMSGVAYALEASLPLLRSAGRGASVVIALSTSALKGAPITAEYTASKHGALGLVRVASRTLGVDGIRVNAVCPGAMDTPMLAEALASAPEGTRSALESAIPLGYVSNPLEVARVICFLLSPDASYVTGAAIPVDGGMIV
jgi:NAD(P)-dependent dehydrogenase (short-subunit alcohol dehydrogenase family)